MEKLEITKDKFLAQPLYTISYEVGEEDIRTVQLPPGIPTRNQVIDAVITNEYPIDKMEAVINNYLLDPTDEDNLTEFNVMQAYRRFAKSIGDEWVEYINNLS